eukprot:CAMPEP_0167772378 /NCGR_PEP_ID=MMETSP0111_2-20121227/812_1 /TAXON_ID=91324 /ORGANISM="Lotharella globosa, Strain CCCM811" /LENGTH=153 /DNA_ID=CAMNT_0007661859 /DNA_START=68 /DNA_END=529 /DNA_ORIENTATION=-
MSWDTGHEVFCYVVDDKKSTNKNNMQRPPSQQNKDTRAGPNELSFLFINPHRGRPGRALPEDELAKRKPSSSLPLPSVGLTRRPSEALGSSASDGVIKPVLATTSISPALWVADMDGAAAIEEKNKMESGADEARCGGGGLVDAFLPPAHSKQ